MTDNNANELLRKLLDERGIVWKAGLEGVTWVGDWCFVEYKNGKLAATCEPSLTPEQAVAATLGRPTWRNSYDQKRYDRWYNSLHHEGEPANFTEFVEDIIWTCETVDMGPNGNTCQGVDEGEVNTESLIKMWADKAATLGADDSRWYELFGTPERAARTLARMCFMSDGSCAGCPMFKHDVAHCKSDYTDLKSIVEWLESEVSDD